jgi:dUTP pyrophosphatase
MRVYRNDKLRALDIEFSAPRPGDAGYDLFAIEDYRVAPGQRVLAETGLHLELPDGHVGLVKDRSSVAAAGLHTLAGVIDSAYRGELKILLVNLSAEGFDIRAGQKIAQLLVVPVYGEAVEFVDSLEDLTSTVRGAGGFGSTGE